MKTYTLIALILCFFSIPAFCHQEPNSVLVMLIKSKGIETELLLPIAELEIAYGKRLSIEPEKTIQKQSKEIKTYILNHFKPETEDGKKWTVNIKDMSVGTSHRTSNGNKKVLIVHLLLQPPTDASTRQFVLKYDVILHNVLFHKALVWIKQDWNNGILGDNESEIGSISLDMEKNIIAPLNVNLKEGSAWKGFKSMVLLGVDHIAEGIDHILFLLVLLLPATLIARNKRWDKFGGAKYSIWRLVKITSAFTLGHSVTLLFGALGWLKVPPQAIEIFIAITILITAIHAFRPLFPNKEMFIACAFGLVHGMAFATTLTELQLETGKLILSILGFNIGIEMMQLFIILLVIPWLIILSAFPIYQWFRRMGATFAIIAALGWIAERTTMEENFISNAIQAGAKHSKYIVIFIATLALVRLGIEHVKKKKINLQDTMES